MITAYDNELFIEGMEEDIYWNLMFYGTLALVLLSLMITFALIISCLLKKLFLNRVEPLKPRNTSTPLLHHHHRRQMSNPLYDVCDDYV